ncbi:MAG TPA: T9SS type A sorting domain-containing protein, partial [Bacteroidetes bacterium]|nr:T9SS type A sorting domain-containing protein [Bacteroidota bacterium]
AYVKNLTLPNGNEGTVYAVIGNSGSMDSNPGLQYPAHYAGDGCDTCIGSFVLDIHGDTLRGRYLKASGEIGDDFSIYKIGQDPTAVKPEVSRLNKVEIFPNPFMDKMTIHFDLRENTELKISLLDMAGKQNHLIFQGKAVAGPQQHTISAQKLQLSAGNYRLRIAAESETIYENVVRIK